jgi:CheY-like chemotaxis protein
MATPNREQQVLDGLRVLVVEDTFLVAETISDQLQDCGCVVIGPASRVQAALDLARNESLDGALLDINLAGEYCFPVAAELSAREIPFVFLTGYSDAATLPPEFRERPRMAKPFDGAELTRTIARHFGRADRT